MRLSIIIPYHNSLKLTEELLNMLIPQLTNQCELIIVDDDVHTLELDKYSSSNIQIIHHDTNSGCAGKPRNTGLNRATGDYITFIDSDDMVVDNYIELILNKINEIDFDYCLFSWQFNGKRNEKVIITEYPPDWNCSIWNCVYSKNTIGNERFDEKMQIAEDYDFNLRVRKGKKTNIETILYLYNDNRKGSVTSEYKR